MVKITKTDNVGKDMAQGEFPYAAGGSTQVHALWKTVWYYLLKSMRHITCDQQLLSWVQRPSRNTCPQAKKQERRMITATLSITPPNGSSKGPSAMQWIKMIYDWGILRHNFAVQHRKMNKLQPQATTFINITNNTEQRIPTHECIL